jgi:hypothetical protein
MNTLARFVSIAAVLGAAFSLVGCVTHPARSSRAKVVQEFSVVESSTEKELTPEQVADLRQAVANYLQSQGLADGRTYYVKVTFPSANPDEEPQWAVVRIGGQSVQTYTVVAAYPGRDDYYPYDFYSPGYSGYSFSSYYPGYGGFSRWGYYDPFDYNYGYYHRPVPRDPNGKDKPDQPGKKPEPPTGTHTRWTNPPPKDGDDQHRASPRNADPDRWHNRTDTRDQQPRSTSRPDWSQNQPDRSYTPPERSYTPPERSSPPPERTYTPPPDNTNSSRSEAAHGDTQQSRVQER